jgi:predicted nucleic acid-binding Zn ribbon protein
VVGELIGRVAEQAGIGRSPQLQRLEEAWREAVGRATASQTRIQGLRAGVLTIEVTSSALAQELMVYYRRDLLARLREQAGAALVELRFRVTGQPPGQPVAPGKSEGGA